MAHQFTYALQLTEVDWKQYRTAVNAIEKATGYNLLSALLEAIQNEIEIKVDNL